MIRTRSICVLLASIVAFTWGCSTSQNQSPAIEGSWQISSAMMGGQDLPIQGLQGTPLVLQGGHYTFQNDTGDYSIVPATSPAAIDVHGVHGPNAGKTIPAIYKLEGDTLTICYNLLGTDRPAEFASGPGSQLFLARYTRTTQ